MSEKSFQTKTKTTLTQKVNTAPKAVIFSSWRLFFLRWLLFLKSWLQCFGFREIITKTKTWDSILHDWLWCLQLIGNGNTSSSVLYRNIGATTTLIRYTVWCTATIQQRAVTGHPYVLNHGTRRFLLLLLNLSRKLKVYITWQLVVHLLLLHMF